MKVNNYDDLEYIYRFDDKKNNEKDNKTTNRTNNDLDKTAFLRLLTTQLANQDPLNPIEDREFIAQLAQFTALEQMQNLNKTVETLGGELLDSIEMLNVNQIQANIQLLKEVINIRKAMESYFGVEPDPGKIDKFELKIRVEMVKRLKEDNFTKESWAVLQEAINMAMEVIKNEEATDSEIENAYRQLLAAVEGLEGKESK